MLRAIEIRSVEALDASLVFGAAGRYERVVAIAHGEVDPAHPGNRGIALIECAPRNARGCVEYATEVHVLRPCDPALGNGGLLHEVNNRGRKMLFGTLADAPGGGNDPRSADDFGNRFPLSLGFTLVWSGWDPDAPTARGGLALQAPVARRDGQPIVAPVRDEFVSGTRAGELAVFRLSHTAAFPEPGRARLTCRARPGDAPQALPPDDWRFVDARTVPLREGLSPRPGWLYELHYEAVDPRVQGLGFAATRDLISHLRHHPDALALTGQRMAHCLAIGISQAGRYLRDHIGQGFNRDEQGRRVFDGVLSHIAGVGRVFLNAPFAQPARTSTQHEDHGYPENAFPFASARLTDPLSGRCDALLREDGSDPLLIEINTATEYWQKGASLLHTDPLGERDLDLPSNTRVYLVAGTQHGARAGTPGDCGPAVNPRNPHNPMPVVRALLLALWEWVRDGRQPPPSQVPRLAEGTLVPAESLAFPAIPGAGLAERTHRIGLPGDWVHPQDSPRAYRTLVCRVDEDGNEVAGIRLPEVAVPVATLTGWNLYRSPWPEGELADRDGSRLPFPADRAEREARGDPRRSVAERYADDADRAERVRVVVEALLAQRLLLPQDAAALMSSAQNR
jgi:hypothetical protein